MLELLAKMGKETVEMDVSGPDMAGGAGLRAGWLKRHRQGLTGREKKVVGLTGREGWCGKLNVVDLVDFRACILAFLLFLSSEEERRR